MKKKYMGVAAGVIALALLLLFYFLLRNNNEETDSKEDKIETAFSTKKDEIKEITFQSENGNYKFVKEEDVWKYEENLNYPLNQTSLDEVLDKAVNISASRTLDNPESIADFGLDSPAVSVFIKNTDGTEQTLQIGDTNDVTSSCYMTVNEDQTKVYMVSSDVVTGLMVDINNLAEKESFPSITGSTVTNITIQKQNQSLKVEKNDSSTTGWVFKNWDGKENEAGSSQVSTYFNQLSSFTWSSYVNSKNVDLEQYGLNDPVTITIHYQQADTSEESAENEDSEEEKMLDLQEVLYLGNKDENGNYYAYLENQNNIYTISATAADELLNVTVDSFMDTYVSNYSFADLDKVTVNINNTSYVFSKKTEEKESDKEEDEPITETKYYLNEKEIGLDEFTSFYGKVSDMQCQERLNAAESTSGNPEVSIQFFKDNGLNVTTEYYSYDANFYLVKDSKGNNSLVNKMKVKEMINAFNTLLDSTKQ